MIKEALDEKYSYQIDEYDMVHLFRGEEATRRGKKTSYKMGRII